MTDHLRILGHVGKIEALPSLQICSRPSQNNGDNYNFEFSLVGKIWGSRETVKSPIVWNLPDIWKVGYRNLNQCLTKLNSAKRNATELSKHVWELNYKGAEFTLSWKIIARARMYANTTKRCNLCLTEKFFIICRPQLCTLNRRNELTSACRHATKYLILILYWLISLF